MAFSLTINTIGKLPAKCPEQELIQRYSNRLPWKLEIFELELKKNISGKKLKSEETRLLLSKCDTTERLVALDERGKHVSSLEFAQLLGKWQEEGVQNIAFLIGGADGLDHAQLPQNTFKLSLGHMTWPHTLARVLLIEQLYRTYTILIGHPYHRE